ncbi:MAG: CDP-alcohol phosphatidyltransferase family protein [Planctomycetes bacterium]|nr:CDP-alcohol phosphatidyltransferase family protein [Planctomycetota bacterium]
MVGGVGTSICILTLPLWTAGILFALGDILDYLDGDLARRQGTSSSEGAIFDAALEAYRPPWVRYARFSAAAAIVFLIGLVGVFRFATVETVPSGLTSGTGLQKNLVPGRDAAGAHESPEAVANRDSQPRRPAVQTEVCLHATYVEAAECDRPNVAHPAMPIPAARRGRGRTTTAPIPLPQEEIDKSRKVGSIVRSEDRP